MKQPEYDNYIIAFDASTEFQECGTLQQALESVKELVDEDNIAPSDIILYGCTEIKLDISTKSEVKVAEVQA